MHWPFAFMSPILPSSLGSQVHKASRMLVAEDSGSALVAAALLEAASPSDAIAQAGPFGAAAGHADAAGRQGPEAALLAAPGWDAGAGGATAWSEHVLVDRVRPSHGEADTASPSGGSETGGMAGGGKDGDALRRGSWLEGGGLRGWGEGADGGDETGETSGQACGVGADWAGGGD